MAKTKFGWIVLNSGGEVLWYSAAEKRYEAQFMVTDALCGEVGYRTPVVWKKLYQEGYRAVKFGIGCIDSCDTPVNHEF